MTIILPGIGSSGLLGESAGAGGTGNGALAYYGSDATANYSGGVTLSYDTELYDSGGWFSTGVPTKMIVPAGITYAEFSCGMIPITNSTSNQLRSAEIRKGGSSLSPVVISRRTEAITDIGFVVSTGPLAVTPGDEFTVLFTDQDTSSTVKAGTWFASKKVG